MLWSSLLKLRQLLESGGPLADKHPFRVFGVSTVRLEDAHPGVRDHPPHLSHILRGDVDDGVGSGFVLGTTAANRTLVDMTSLRIPGRHFVVGLINFPFILLNQTLIPIIFFQYKEKRLL